MKPARLIRRLLPVLVLLALLTLALWPSARRVDSARVDTGPIRASFEAEGRTRLRDRYLISAPVAGVARRQSREPGDAIARGEVLVELDPLASAGLDPRSRAEAQARLEAARAREQAAAAAREAAEAAAELARVESQRIDRLAEAGLAASELQQRAASSMRQREREAASARFQAAAAAHEAEMAAAALAPQGGGASDSFLRLASPVDGLLLRRQLESARPVAVGEALLEVGDPASMEVEVDVLSADAVQLREGMRVELLRWGEPEPLQGSVRRIEPAAYTKLSALGVEEQRVWVRVSIDSPQAQWQRLGDGYRVVARFLLQEIGSALRVPASAPFRHDGGWAVFLIEDGRARLQPIQPGIAGEGFIEVRAGLQQGMEVIVHPERSLAAGERVRARP